MWIIHEEVPKPHSFFRFSFNPSFFLFFSSFTESPPYYSSSTWPPFSLPPPSFQRRKRTLQRRQSATAAFVSNEKAIDRLREPSEPSEDAAPVTLLGGQLRAPWMRASGVLGRGVGEGGVFGVQGEVFLHMGEGGGRGGGKGSKGRYFDYNDRWIY